MNPTTQRPMTGLGSTAETNRLLGGQYFNEQTGAQIQSFIPRTSPPLTFDAAALAEPTAPITLKPDNPSTLASGMTGANDAYIQSIGDLLKADEEAKQKESDAQKGKVQGIIDKITGKQAEKQEAIGDKNTPGTPAWQKEQARVLGLEFDKVQRAQLNELKELDLREGLSGSGKAAIRQRINTRYAMDSADLQLKFHIAQSDYNASIDTLNQKFELELEPLKMQLEQERDLYNQMRDDLSKSEDREFNFLISEHETELKNKREDKKEIADIFETLQTENPDALKQNPQLAVELSKAENGMDAIRMIADAGISMSDPLDRAQKVANLAKTRAETNKIVSENSDKSVVTPYQKERQTRILQSVDELRKRVNFQTVGVGVLGNKIPASLPRNFKTDLETLRSSIAFSELTAMREASKTGGALGQVSDIELGLLESALAGLDQGQSPANFRKNLDKVEASIARWQAAVNGLSEEDELLSAGYTPEQIEQIKNAK